MDIRHQTGRLSVVHGRDGAISEGRIQVVNGIVSIMPDPSVQILVSVHDHFPGVQVIKAATAKKRI